VVSAGFWRGDFNGDRRWGSEKHLIGEINLVGVTQIAPAL
jgi:hypothetical protein